MFEIFPDGPVYEYPEVINVTYSFLWSFVLASMIAISHRLTYTGVHYPKNFFQSLVLGAIVTAMVMMAIGDSLARGLGVFGAMAIIRFRTRIDDPRDVLFLFAALSTGLAIGVYGFVISFAGTVLFCIAAFILHSSQFRHFTYQHTIQFTLEEVNSLGQVVEVVSKYCSAYRQTGIQVNKEKMTRYKYSVSLKKDSGTDLLIAELKKIEGMKQVALVLNELINL